VSEAPCRRLRLLGSRSPEAIAAQAEEIGDFARRCGCPDSVAQQIALVAEEVMVNIARHAWPEGVPHSFSVELEARRGADSVEILLIAEDDGRPFDPTAATEPDLDAPLEDRPVGGLGIHFMRSMTDAQSYSRENGRNRLVLRKACPLGAVG
jgi:anti-sigma regulatory factor (Ser/Thr protein kinase)